MTSVDIGSVPAELPPHSAAGVRPKFKHATEFHHELKVRVADYFARTGFAERGLARMYLKSIIILLWFATSWAALVFAADTVWMGMLFGLSLAFSVAGIGFNIQHDGSHGGYSNSGRVNKLMARAIDLIGGSSYLWHWKHNVLHHSYPNVQGADDDIDVGILGRLAPSQQHMPFHRFQQYYMWALYGVVPFKWHLWDDFVELASGKVGTQSIPRPKGKELVVLIAGKAIFYSLAFVIPALFHPLWVVLLYYVAISFTLGVVIGTVFQLAHCVAEAEFSLPVVDTNRMEAEWAVHQVESTVDFSRGNPFITWFLGGLNYQIEHHLFPRVSHIHYPALAPIVESVCRKFGVSYNAHGSLGGAMASHFQWLRVMGQPETALGTN